MLLAAQPMLAADSLISGEMKAYIGYGAVVCTLLVIVAALLIVLQAFKVLTRLVLKAEGYTEEQIQLELKPAKPAKPTKAEVFNKLLSLKPLSEEKSILIEHDYDGIQELDNPTPAWFMYLFYATIVFAVAYLFTYHVLGIGQLQYDEYKTEMAVAAKEKAVYLAKAANRVDENTVKVSTEPAMLASGQAIFKQNCVPCHGDHGQGVVGPNLTDDYWLHGGKINDVFKTIKYGITTKGMPTWEKQLSPGQIADVANYIKSLHGTNPAGAKEPQGTKEEEGAANATLKTAMLIKK
ncbi:cbb3-type cytochrome c oxidase N-terminal domain-containing protein [Mucilaginibacter robiniae]|nr:cbb3-type cytochrome c oxidase N-terminal domain-containing protein [Mucilaginibacter robiniae]